MSNGFDGDWQSVPDVIEPLVGYRGFRVRKARTGSGYELVGNMSVQWPVGEPLHARCLSNMCEETPSSARDNSHSGYGCGIYVWKEPFPYFVTQSVTAIWAKVRCWGRFVEHTAGWRVEYAEIIGIIENPLRDTVTDALFDGIPTSLRMSHRNVSDAAIADTYGVPIIDTPTEIQNFMDRNPVPAGVSNHGMHYLHAALREDFVDKGMKLPSSIQTLPGSINYSQLSSPIRLNLTTISNQGRKTMRQTTMLLMCSYIILALYFWVAAVPFVIDHLWALSIPAVTSIPFGYLAAREFRRYRKL